MNPSGGGSPVRGLARAQRAWQFVLYPEAGEGGGSRHVVCSESGSDWPPLDPEEAARRSGEEAQRRARGKVRRYCAANRLNRLGTLTYAGAGCHDPAEVRTDVGEFMRALRRRVGQRFAYLWVPEWHPGGHGLHLHFAVGQFIRRRDIESAWGRGFISIKLLGDLPTGSGALAEGRVAGRYLGKYLGKGWDSEEDAWRATVGAHRYEVAEGFQPREIDLGGETDLEVLGWAEDLMSGPPARTWYSNETDGWHGPPAVWASWDR
ncbi:MAG TPA: hypothetical protein VED59_05865 [Acidimicrobiales bacterium]|nr:hypothetical protein [Acidimicrobiales bacterium]